jgi:adenylosuccinate lyase
MLSRTHGQSASPTTFGKEMRVFEVRLARQMKELSTRSVFVKIGGATGNWNAHTVAAPDVDWVSFAKKFVEGLNEGHAVKLELNEVTTQIEPHDTYAEMFDNARRINTILTDLSQDMWRYISDGWITQRPKEGEIGSSAMPHKVNPIDFENAEGTLGSQVRFSSTFLENSQSPACSATSLIRRSNELSGRPLLTRSSHTGHSSKALARLA